MTPLLVTRAEAAKALRTDVDHIDELVAAGRLPVVELWADQDGPLFRPEDLLALIDSAGRPAVAA